MMGVLAYLALVVVIPALVCGHHGEDWPLRGAWRALAPVWRPQPASCGSGDAGRAPGPSGGRTGARASSDAPSRRAGSRQSASQASGGGFPAAGRPSRSQERSEPHVPTWARTEQEAV